MNFDKTKIGITVVVVVLLAGLFFWNHSEAPKDVSSTGDETTDTATDTKPVTKTTSSSGNVVKPTPLPPVNPPATTGSQGRVVFSITDAAAVMTTIEEIDLKINRIEVHNAGGWVTIPGGTQTFDLLWLKRIHKIKLLADVGLKTGNYDQVRLFIDSVMIKTKTGSVQEAKLPGNEIKINTPFTVSTGQIASINFDFLADKSLHTTGSGSYIFAPVLKVNAKTNANVTIDGASTVEILGGSSINASQVGMDVSGVMKPNFQIDASLILDIENGKITETLPPID